jgi:hypothetical protein
LIVGGGLFFTTALKGFISKILAFEVHHDDKLLYSRLEKLKLPTSSELLTLLQ